MGFLLSLQTLDRDGRETRESVVASVFSVSVCQSTASVTAC